MALYRHTTTGEVKYFEEPFEQKTKKDGSVIWKSFVRNEIDPSTDRTLYDLEAGIEETKTSYTVTEVAVLKSPEVVQEVLLQYVQDKALKMRSSTGSDDAGQREIYARVRAEVDDYYLPSGKNSVDESKYPYARISIGILGDTLESVMVSLKARIDADDAQLLASETYQVKTSYAIKQAITAEDKLKAYQAA